MSANSARARGLAYANQVSAAKQTRRSAQPNVFGKAKSGPPTYAFQDQQRGPVDDIADETSALRHQEKEIADDKDEDIVDRKDFTSGPSTGKAPATNKTTAAPAAPTNELKSAFAKCWTIVDTIDIPALQHDQKSWYLPSSVSLFEVLSNMEEILSGNEELRWVSPNYFSLPVRVYYAVIFYVQVLRAKEQAGTLSKSEGSWLRAFFRRYKDTMCPIAGPLVPILSNIVSCLPDDDQFDYVHPGSLSQGTYSVTHTGNDPTQNRTLTTMATNHLFPNVPLVASLLRNFCSSAALPNTKFDASGQFVPFTITTGSGNAGFAGVDFPAHVAGTANPAIARLISNPALSHPLPESKDRLKEIHGFWKRSKCRSIPEILNTVDFNPQDVGGMTLLTENLDWFQPCVDMANVNIKFFSDSTNLSAIPTVGGMSSTVVAELKFNVDGNTPPALPDTVDEWYPDFFSSAKASFKATAAELSLDHKYAAAYALTNATYEWHTANASPIGSIAAGHRAGPYFENTKVTYQLEHEVPVMTGIYTMLQTHFYDAHGKA
jgi:hypothetical protein